MVVSLLSSLLPAGIKAVIVILVAMAVSRRKNDNNQKSSKIKEDFVEKKQEADSFEDSAFSSSLLLMLLIFLSKSVFIILVCRSLSAFSEAVCFFRSSHCDFASNVLALADFTSSLRRDSFSFISSFSVLVFWVC